MVSFMLAVVLMLALTACGNNKEAQGLPIYHYDDIPSRYESTNLSGPVTEEKAGEVHYSEPNRIILFYGDATEEFINAVVNNPVVEGWGNKIISISASE